MKKSFKVAGIVSAIILLVCLPTWFGLFFGLNFPEIDINEHYLPSDCYPVQKSIQSAYECNYVCGSDCDQADSTINTCIFNQNLYNNLDPQSCGSNTTSCAPVSSYCNNGYKCCQIGCETCCNYVTKCDEWGVCKTTCVPIECNCRCIRSINNHRCLLKCPITYITNVKYQYDTIFNETETTTTYSKYFSTDLTAAQDYLDSLNPNKSIDCFYDERNPSKLEFETGYTVGYWVVTGVFSAGVLIGLILFTYWILGMYMRSVTESAVNPIVFTLWTSILLPVGFLLPLMLAVRTDDDVDVIILYVLMQMMTIGFATIPINFVEPFGSLNISIRLIYYFVFFYIPFGILAPLYYNLKDTHSGAFIILIMVFLMPIFFLIFVRLIPYSWSRFKATRARSQYDRIDYEQTDSGRINSNSNGDYPPAYDAISKF
jgi:hypothetical protein